MDANDAIEELNAIKQLATATDLSAAGQDEIVPTEAESVAETLRRRRRHCLNRGITVAGWRPRTFSSSSSSSTSESKEGEDDEIRVLRHTAKKLVSRRPRADVKIEPNDSDVKPIVETIEKEGEVEVIQTESKSKWVQLAASDNMREDIAKIGEITILSPLSAFVDNRERLVSEAFSSITDRILFGIVPPLLKDEMTLSQLKSASLAALKQFSREQILSILSGGVQPDTGDHDVQPFFIEMAEEKYDPSAEIAALPTSARDDDLFADVDKVIREIQGLDESSARHDDEAAEEPLPGHSTVGSGPSEPEPDSDELELLELRGDILRAMIQSNLACASRREDDANPEQPASGPFWSAPVEEPEKAEEEAENDAAPATAEQQQSPPSQAGTEKNKRARNYRQRAPRRRSSSSSSSRSQSRKDRHRRSPNASRRQAKRRARRRRRSSDDSYSSCDDFDWLRVYGRHVGRDERASPSLFYRNPSATLASEKPPEPERRPHRPHAESSHAERRHDCESSSRPNIFSSIVQVCTGTESTATVDTQSVRSPLEEGEIDDDDDDGSAKTVTHIISAATSPVDRQEVAPVKSIHSNGDNGENTRALRITIRNSPPLDPSNAHQSSLIDEPLESIPLPNDTDASNSDVNVAAALSKSVSQELHVESGACDGVPDPVDAVETNGGTVEGVESVAVDLPSEAAASEKVENVEPEATVNDELSERPEEADASSSGALVEARQEPPSTDVRESSGEEDVLELMVPEEEVNALLV